MLLEGRRSHENAPRTATQWDAFGAGLAGFIAISANSLAGIYAARALGPSNYGYVAFFFSLLGLIVLAGALGLTTRVTMAAAAEINGATNPEPEIEALAFLRLISLAPLFVIGLLLFTFRQELAVPLALVIGSVYLLRGFLAGILQGYGHLTVAAAMESLQGIIYLVLLLIGWGRSLSGVYGAIAASHITALSLGIFAITQVRPLTVAHLCLHKAQVRRFLAPLTNIYGLTLLLAAYGPFGGFVLGSAGHVHETAYFNVGMSLVGIVATIGNIMLTYVYYPRQCRLAASTEAAASWTWYRNFFAGFAIIGMSTAILFSLFARLIVDLLYTEQYLPATLTVSALAWANLFYMLQQLTAWTLVARGDFARPIRAALVQFAMLVLSGWITARWSPRPLEMMTLIYVLVAILGWLLTMRAMRQNCISKSAFWPLKTHIPRLARRREQH